ENVLRARGATAVLLKNSLPYVRRSVMGTGRVRDRLEAEQRRIADTHAPPQPRRGGGNCPPMSVAHGARASSPRPLRPFAASVHRPWRPEAPAFAGRKPRARSPRLLRVRRPGNGDPCPCRKRGPWGTTGSPTLLQLDGGSCFLELGLQ